MAKKENKSAKSEVQAIIEAAKASLKADKKDTKKPDAKNDAKKDAPAEKALNTKVYANIIRKALEGGGKEYVIKNMKDLPKDIQKGLKAFHHKEVTEKTTTQLKAAMKALGVTTNKDSAVVMPEREKKQAPPKFEARTYEVGGNSLVELGRNHEPKAGDMYLVITEEKKKKKTVTDIMVTYLMYPGNNVGYLLVPKTEDAIIITPEMLKKREIWSIDLDTKERITGTSSDPEKTAMHGLLVPVKKAKEDKKAVNE